MLTLAIPLELWTLEATVRQTDSFLPPKCKPTSYTCLELPTASDRGSIEFKPARSLGDHAKRESQTLHGQCDAQQAQEATKPSSTPAQRSSKLRLLKRTSFPVPLSATGLQPRYLYATAAHRPPAPTARPTLSVTVTGRTDGWTCCQQAQRLIFRLSRIGWGSPDQRHAVKKVLAPRATAGMSQRNATSMPLDAKIFATTVTRPSLAWYRAVRGELPAEFRFHQESRELRLCVG